MDRKHLLATTLIVIGRRHRRGAGRSLARQALVKPARRALDKRWTSARRALDDLARRASFIVETGYKWHLYHYLKVRDQYLPQDHLLYQYSTTRPLTPTRLFRFLWYVIVFFGKLLIFAVKKSLKILQLLMTIKCDDFVCFLCLFSGIFCSFFNLTKSDWNSSS